MESNTVEHHWLRITWKNSGAPSWIDVMFLINQGIIHPNQFTETKEHGGRMDKTAVSAHLKNDEKYMATPIRKKQTRNHLPSRGINWRDAQRTEKIIIENTKYEPHYFYEREFIF